MSKGLDALKELYGAIRCENSHNLEACSVLRETIEKELKEHEQYKAIEQELSIDIPTYFKIRKAEKVYTKDELGRIDEKYLRDNVDGISVFSEGFASIPECDETLYISGYGKDWALTREELKKWLK